MKKLEIVNNLSRTFNKVGFAIKKHSPEILITAGVVGTIASTAMACKATLKVNQVLEVPRENIKRINEAVEKGHTEAGEEYSVADSKNDLRILYTQTGVELFKLYAPAVALGALSITAIVTSHRILTKRNVALAAAYTVVDKGFKEYRGRVVERFGNELDRELRHNIKAKKVEEVVVDEKGKEKTVKKTVNVIDPNEVSDYARIWYEGNPGWTKDPEYNLMYLKMQQNYANNKLQSQGYLYLNEVYEMLGFPKTKAGHVVGWVFDKECPAGDNFVDFGIYDKPEFVNGYERSILLDFNVDGNIYELMY